MSTIQEIDKFNRKIISILFRMLIVGYSIFLLIYFDPEFNWWVNVGIIAVYGLIYVLFYARDGWLSTIRLINDYIFIGVILFQLDKLDIYGYALLLAPILNTHNHSGDRKSMLLYIIPLVIYLFVTDDLSIWIIFPFFLFLAINSFDHLRSKYFIFQQKLSSAIDDFFVNDYAIRRPHEIYKKIIPILNNNKILRKEIEHILCFKIEKKTYSIVNGSTFIWNFEILDKEIINKEIKNKSEILFNIRLNVDGKVIENNVVIICQVNSHKYCFVLFSKNNLSLDRLPYSFFISKILIPSFSRLALVLDAGLTQKKIELENLNRLEEKMTYVTNSVNSMHFIRNKLGPLKSYLAMVEDFNDTDDLDKKERIEPYLRKEREKLKTSFFLILEKADYILKKSNNPFNVYETSIFSVRKLFSEIRRIWGYYFLEEVFDINWTVPRDGTKGYVRYNTTGLELVLSNWINNMQKYNNGKFGVRFIQSDKYYTVIFYNAFDNKKKNATLFVEEFNATERSEIIRRDSHGLLEIKDFLSQMQIPVKLSHLEGVVSLSLEFKKINDEKSINI